MNTPICDFVKGYRQQEHLRLHMPGHKGSGPLGIEPLDITEIVGADSLYEARGIIRESERNAGSLYGAQTFYSTEGSSLCIRAMLYLTALYAGRPGKRVRIAAGRNAHRTFLSACALLDLDVIWLLPDETASHLSCRIDPAALEAVLGAEAVDAVYVTSPDYLGNIADLASIAEVCHRHGVLLLVDNAHGAYLKFLSPSRHPMDLGADLCCDSAHKTLPALTGAAYLHISHRAPAELAAQAKTAMAVFGSTSPSYLILQSLDALNHVLEDGYSARLAAFCAEAARFREKLSARGCRLMGDEPLKLTIRTKKYGYPGDELARLLAGAGVVCEFSDPDFVVFMLTPETGTAGLSRLEKALSGIPERASIADVPPAFRPQERVLSLRETLLAPRELIPTSDCVGRILAEGAVSCPPAVPIVLWGERMDRYALQCFEYYGIDTCVVVKE